MDLAGKVPIPLVTSTTSVIGRATAIALAAGRTYGLAARRDESRGRGGSAAAYSPGSVDLDGALHGQLAPGQWLLSLAFRYPSADRWRGALDQAIPDVVLRTGQIDRSLG